MTENSSKGLSGSSSDKESEPEEAEADKKGYKGQLLKQKRQGQALDQPLETFTGGCCPTFTGHSEPWQP